MTQRSSSFYTEYMYEKIQERQMEEELLREEQNHQMQLEQLRWEEHLRDQKLKELLEVMTGCAKLLIKFKET